jgi:hypothetical protein
MPVPAGRLDVPRAEGLLRSASLLLARGRQLDAPHALHVELARELGQAPPAAYASPRQAEEAHRQLSAELARQRGKSRATSTRQWLARRLPQWAAWASTCAILAFLVLRYGYALYSRWGWQHQHPDGPWISRYYSKRNFQEYQLTRYDVGIDYNWGKGAPAEAMDRDHWSALWDTCLVVKKEKKVPVTLMADDVGKLWIDDTLKITIKTVNTKRATLHLEPGIHHLRVEYQERRRGSKVKLSGLDPNGNEFYSFQRPRLEGEKGQEQVICDGKH